MYNLLDNYFKSFQEKNASVRVLVDTAIFRKFQVCSYFIFTLGDFEIFYYVICLAYW